MQRARCYKFMTKENSKLKFEYDLEKAFENVNYYNWDSANQTTGHFLLTLNNLLDVYAPYIDPAPARNKRKP